MEVREVEVESEGGWGCKFTSKETPTLLGVQRRSSGPRVDENSSRKFFVSRIQKRNEKKKKKKEAYVMVCVCV